MIPTSQNSLSGLPDSELVALVKDEQNDEAFKEICRRYEKVYYKVCHKYIPCLNNCGVQSSDVFEEKDAVIYNSIRSFNPEKKTKLLAWISNCARYHCLSMINKRKHIFAADGDLIQEAIENAQKSNTNMYVDKVSQDMVNIVLSQIDEIEDKKMKEVLNLRYLQDKKMTWAQVSKTMGLEPHACVLLNERAISILKKRLKKNFDILVK